MDDFDFKILDALQRNGQKTNYDLAELAGLSASQCSRRRAALEEDGVIEGYHAKLSAEKLGLKVQVFVQVTLATHSPDNSKRFAKLISDLDEVQEAYALTGERRLRAQARGRGPAGAVTHPERRAAAAPKRRACALVDRAGADEAYEPAAAAAFGEGDRGRGKEAA